MVRTYVASLWEIKRYETWKWIGLDGLFWSCVQQSSLMFCLLVFVSLLETRLPFSNQYMLECMSLHTFRCTEALCVLHKFYYFLDSMFCSISRHFFCSAIMFCSSEYYVVVGFFGYVTLSVISSSVTVSFTSPPLSVCIHSWV